MNYFSAVVRPIHSSRRNVCQDVSPLESLITPKRLKNQSSVIQYQEHIGDYKSQRTSK